MRAIPFFRFQLYFSLLFLPLFAFSQGKQANNWYFGDHAGITFNEGSSPVALLNSQIMVGISNNSGCATISDDDGNLLFYSNGITIWNRNHSIMPNGSDLGTYTTQGAMIVKDPGQDNLYYFFNFMFDQVVWQTKFQYSVIDMNLDNGLGDVVTNKKSILLINNTTTHLSAVMHSNSNDIWVVTHGLGTRNYYAFLVTSDSLHHQPVSSNVGGIFPNTLGYMKISANGRKIGSAVFLGTNPFFELLDFDNETGLVTDNNIVHRYGDFFGIEFSPDNSKFYVNGGWNRFFQYDLKAGDPQAILNSEFLLTTSFITEGALQLAPDGKIYCATRNEHLSVINYPNLTGLSCGYEADVIFLGGNGRRCLGGLPSFIQSYLNDPEFTTTWHCLGQPTQFTITNTNGIDSVKWIFNESILYTGLYEVTLFASDNVTGDFEQVGHLKNGILPLSFESYQIDLSLINVINDQKDRYKYYVLVRRQNAPGGSGYGATPLLDTGQLITGTHIIEVNI